MSPKIPGFQDFQEIVQLHQENEADVVLRTRTGKQIAALWREKISAIDPDRPDLKQAANTYFAYLQVSYLEIAQANKELEQASPQYVAGVAEAAQEQVDGCILPLCLKGSTFQRTQRR